MDSSMWTSMANTNPDPLTMEITVLSAQGLKNPSSFSKRLRPFIALSTSFPCFDSTPSKTTGNAPTRESMATSIDRHGGENPTWGDTFRVTLDSSSFADLRSSVLLQVYNKSLISGRTQLGWCRVPLGDIEWPCAGWLRFLSYRLRARDGTRSHGTVNVAVKVEGPFCPPEPKWTIRPAIAGPVIGIPVPVMAVPASVCK